ncbi:NAD(P)H-dependent oxidoreductase [Sphingobacterium anhuiense]|uniref:NAD(P)H-dependent oxidoreductase n=1 Tax=Sphingobacterium anhuiense TaxID=493780 RepID=UPI003C2AE2EE
MNSQNKELKNLLVINSSARNRNAKSRNLAETLIGHWQKIQLNTKIQHRELGNQSIPHITEEWISAAFKPIENRTQDELNALKKAMNTLKN